MNSDDFNELIGVFIAETQEFLQSLETNLLAMEDSTGKARLQSIEEMFRAAHSIKGSALMFGFKDLAKAAHALEDCFAILRDKSDLSHHDRATVTALLQGVDRLKKISEKVLEDVESNVAEDLEAIAQLEAQLKAQYDTEILPPPAVVKQAIKPETIKLIFEIELITVLNRLETEISQVKPETLAEAVSKLNEIYYQLSGVAGMLQLHDFAAIVEQLRGLIDDKELSALKLHSEGWAIAQSLQNARTNILQGKPINARSTEEEGEGEREKGEGEREEEEANPQSPVPSPQSPIPSPQSSIPNPQSPVPMPLIPRGGPTLPQSPVPSPQSPIPNPQSPVPNPQSPLPIPNDPLPIPNDPLPIANPVSSSTASVRPTIRVDLERLTELVNLVGELVINRTNMEVQGAQLRSEVKRIRRKILDLNQFGSQLREEYDRLAGEQGIGGLSEKAEINSSAFSSQSSLLPSESPITHSFDALEMDRYTEFHSTAGEVIETTGAIAHSASKIDELAILFDRSTDRLRRICDELRSRVMQLRVVPFSRVVDRLPRAVRDLSQTHNKEVNLLLIGRDLKIDESLLDALRDPLVHLVRNAFDHGIEPPDVRKAMGKPASGQIEIEARHQGGQTIVTVTDDGQGIDPEAIRRRIVAKELMSYEQTLTLSNAELYEFLFWPGFSTTSEVSALSGRGVGLDVVRTNLRQVRGTVKVDSRPGKGTSFILKLPLMLSIADALLVRTDHSTVAIPLDAVEEILHLEGHQIHRAGTQPMLRWRGEYIRLMRLQDLIKYSIPHPDGPSPDPIAQDYIPILVLASSEGILAIAVERLVGQQEIVVKALPAPMSKPHGIVGCTILGDGQVVTILDVDDLIGQVQMRNSTHLNHSSLPVNPPSPTLNALKVSPPSLSNPQILVVDDSYTIRQLLGLTLMRDRYRVIQAKDGLDALEKLQSGLECSLIIADIEMPRMDGFELLRAIKNNSQLARIPVAMLTSRSGAKHRQTALELGAVHYFTKPYNESQLLEVVAQLLTGKG